MNLKKIATLLIILVILILAIYLVEKSQEKKEQAKMLTKIEPKNINKIEILSGKEKITVKKENSKWKLTHPVKTLADKYSIENLVDNFSKLKPEKQVEEKATNLKKYGLKNPNKGIALYTKNNKEYKIYFGKKGPLSESYYAKLDNSGRVVLLSENKMNSIDKNAFDLRDKHIVRFKTENVDLIELFKNNKERQFIVEKKDNDWYFAEPKMCLADSSKIDDIIYSINNLEAEEIIKDSPKEKDLEKYDLKNPIYLLKINLLNNNKPLTVYISKKNQDKLYSFSKQTNFIANISNTFENDINKNLENLREKRVAVFSGYNIRKLSITRNNTQFIMNKDKNGVWRLKKPNNIILKDEKVSDMISSIEDLEAEEFIDNPKNLADYNLETPFIKIILVPEDNNTINLSISKEEDDNNVYIKNKNFTYIFKTDADFIDKLPDKNKISDWEKVVEEKQTEN